jgi:sugar lactone lactonase YvrE
MDAGSGAEPPGDGRLFRLDPGGSVHRMETGLTISNGLGWSPDQRFFYLTDTLRRRIYRYEYDPASGEIANRQDWVRVPEAPGEGLPDGLAVDREGFIWSARWDGWKLVRYDPDGRLEREVRVPVARPTSCAFGGPGLGDLYVTSAWSGLDETTRRSQPWAGDILRLQAGFSGREPFTFAG